MSIKTKNVLYALSIIFSYTLLAESNGTAKKIKKIVVLGCDHYPIDTLINKIPYTKGSLFDPLLSTVAIKNLYTLGYFNNIELSTCQEDDGIILQIKVTEKPRIASITCEGNKNLKIKDIQKKISTDIIPAADDKELNKYCRIIQNMYREKGYNFAHVTAHTVVNNGSLDVTFIIEEGPKTSIKRVFFKGNKHISAKKLRSLLFTKEDWLFGMFERAGMYHPTAIEQDKLTIENFYQSNGFMKATVNDADVVFSDDKKHATVTFHINEGDFYTIDSVSVPGNNLYSEDELKNYIMLRQGQPYSRELIRLTIEHIKRMWGDKGFINADVEPIIQPNTETKKVAVTFQSDLGKKVRLERINIKGNKKSRMHVLLQNLSIYEGEELTTTKLELTKERIKGLGFFDPKEGVNWRLQRIDDESANLEILLKEVKTGRLEYKMNYGGSPGQLSDSNHSITMGVSFMDRNTMGHGILSHLNLQTAIFGDTQRSVTCGFAYPWLFDKPIRVGFDGYYNHNEYDEVRKVKHAIQEHKAGAVFNIGYVLPYGFNWSIINQFGFDSFKLYSHGNNDDHVKPEASIGNNNPTLLAEYQSILDKRMKSGKLAYWQTDVGQDTRNHPVHPSRGHRWLATSKIGFPTGNDTFGFYKLEMDYHWYTPLINETDLVLHLRGHLGYVNSYKKYSIPFKELYNIGGPGSVRGWLFGGISPLWAPPSLVQEEEWQGDPIGGRKGLIISAELIFPIVKDMSIKGAFFYDGGAGWDTPHKELIAPENLKNNSFDYRHAIGFGIRMTSPQPIKVDWAFKLDKRPGEKSTEVSFSSYYDF